MSLRFGGFVRGIRMEKRIGLREFCIQAGKDPSNWSKIERGQMRPPESTEDLNSIANALGLENGSDAWQKIHDLAFIDRTISTKGSLNDDEVVELLPAFMRTIRGQKPSEEEKRRLIELIRNS